MTRNAKDSLTWCSAISSGDLWRSGCDREPTSRTPSAGSGRDRRVQPAASLRQTRPGRVRGRHGAPGTADPLRNAERRPTRRIVVAPSQHRHEHWPLRLSKVLSAEAAEFVPASGLFGEWVPKQLPAPPYELSPDDLDPR